MDSEGTSDAYAKVSFMTQSLRTRVIKETLCPDWDETLMFEDLLLFGSPSTYADNCPYAVVELFDKDKVVSRNSFSLLLCFNFVSVRPTLIEIVCSFGSP